jgi:hypothetical protein
MTASSSAANRQGDGSEMNVIDRSQGKPPERHHAVGGDAVDPDWSAPRQGYDWRSHISVAVRDLWPTFSTRQRVAIAEMVDYIVRPTWD